MKKVKIMLMAITVFAAVGGALAFKAKKLTTVKYCTSSTSGTCANYLINSTSTSEVGSPAFPKYFYTITTGTDHCASLPNCQSASTTFTLD